MWFLSGIEAGDPHAAAQLLPLVYDELRKLAASAGGERGLPGQALPERGRGPRPATAAGRLQEAARRAGGEDQGPTSGEGEMMGGQGTPRGKYSAKRRRFWTRESRIEAIAVSDAGAVT